MNLRRPLLIGALAATTAVALGHIRLVYNGNGSLLRWVQPSSVSIVIQSSGSLDVPDESDTVAIRGAIEAWNQVDGSTARLVEQTNPSQRDRTDHTAHDVHLIMFDESNTSGYFPPGTGTVALTPLLFYTDGRIVDADILFNGSSYSFTTKGQAGRFDIQDVATHELGHLLGLDHSGVAGSTMFPYVDTTVILHRSLSVDDENGMRDAYGTGGSTTISGRLERGDGSPVRGAHVFALDPDGHLQGAALADASGQFALRGLVGGALSLHAAPLEQPVGAANISEWHQVDLDFALTDLGDVAATPGTSTNLGATVVTPDTALLLGRSFDDYPQRLIQGQTTSHVVRGSGLVPGSTLTPSDSRLMVAPTSWSGTAVHFTVWCPSEVPPGLVSLTVTSPGQERAALVGGLEVTPPSPTVNQVTPAMAAASGGTIVTIVGAGFRPGCHVVVGDRIYTEGAVDGCVLVDSTRLRLALSPTTGGVHDVVVIDPTGVEGRLSDGFWAQASPVVGRVFPDAGQSWGGTTLRLTGTDFQAGSTVTIDGIQQPNVTVLSSNLIEVVTGPGVPGGPYLLTVQAPTGEQATAAFTYTGQADPSLAAVSPAEGPAGGGNGVALEALNLSSTTQVRFGVDPNTGLGGVAATIVQTLTDGVEVQAPAGLTGTVAVMLEDSETGQASVLTGAYTYRAASQPSGGGCASIVPAAGSRHWSDPLAQGGWLVALFALLWFRGRRAATLA